MYLMFRRRQPSSWRAVAAACIVAGGVLLPVACGPAGVLGVEQNPDADEPEGEDQTGDVLSSSDPQATCPALPGWIRKPSTTGEVPRTTGGHREDGTWSNIRTVVEEEQFDMDLPINPSTLKISGELCCYCSGYAVLTIDSADPAFAGFSPTMTSPSVCEEDRATSMIDAAAERGGTLPAVVTLVTEEVIQRDAEGRCLSGTNRELFVNFQDCTTQEFWLGFSQFTYAPKGQLEDAVCADR